MFMRELFRNLRHLVPITVVILSFREIPPP
jgi:hypothetical protein